ncbi:MAG TPA: class III poly(R)-hydroxyalkanoic acid synthase subunit PhaC [Gammaproteobacteria bacterium]|nr:class III poly(R)-hydroxyalkanoic acid synthase subunit PhaC [Gammaproteobacteria bacterium]
MNSVPDSVAEAAELARRLEQSLRQLGELGPATVGGTPRETVLANNKVTLYRYGGDHTHKAPGPALLIVYALVNRPYVLDLEPQRSTIAQLLAQGLDVYLVDWGYPDSGDHQTTLEDYLCDRLDSCVDAVCELRGEPTVNLLGVCQGGTLSLCYSALFPGKVRNLVTMVTPVDFHTPGNLLSRWVQGVALDRLATCYGNVPGGFLNALFLALQPFRLAGQKYMELADLADDPDRLRTFLRMERWIADSPDQAGRAFAEFVGKLFQRNALVRGEMTIGAVPVLLADVTCPVLNIYAQLDHLVPPAASTALADHVGSADYTESAFDGGHIGIYVSQRAQRRIPATIAGWLQARQ